LRLRVRLRLRLRLRVRVRFHLNLNLNLNLFSTPTSTSSHSHLKTFIATIYIAIPQANRIIISGQTFQICPPSNEMLRNASFKAVSGKNLTTFCSPSGKEVIGKKVPDRKYCGNINRFA
jgi:hypothetical protein